MLFEHHPSRTEAVVVPEYRCQTTQFATGRANGVAIVLRCDSRAPEVVHTEVVTFLTIANVDHPGCRPHGLISHFLETRILDERDNANGSIIAFRSVD